MKYTIFLFLAFNSIFLFSQNDFNYYTFKVFKTNESAQKLNNKNLDGIIEDNASDTIEYEMYLTDSLASFTPIFKLNNSQSSIINMSDIFMKSQGSFYYDFKNQTIENYKNSLGKDFIITSLMHDINWEKSNSLDTIGNIICNKAIYKKKETSVAGGIREYIITAWYIENSNPKIAPFGLLGLNGTVIKLDFNGVQSVILDKIERKKKIKMVRPSKNGTRITKSEFDKIINDQLLEMKHRRKILDLEE